MTKAQRDREDFVGSSPRSKRGKLACHAKGMAKTSLKTLRGKLITFEGIEGSGKSTHARLLALALRAKGREIIEVREPGGTRIGEAIRLLLSQKNSHEVMSPQTELLLFMACRAQLVQTIILPALRRGTHVICDRFSDSTSAYQGYARGCDLKLIARINAFAVQNISPDLTILLDLDPRVGFKRLYRRNRRQGTEKDRIESENMMFHERVRNGYLALAGKKTGQFYVINANRPVVTVHADIRKMAQKILSSGPGSG